MAYLDHSPAGEENLLEEDLLASVCHALLTGLHITEQAFSSRSMSSESYIP